MNITIVGASQGVWLATVKRALERWHTVTAVSRSETLLDPNFLRFSFGDRLHAIRGSALDRDILKCSLVWSEALIVTLGNKSFWWTTLFSEFATLLTELNPQIPCIILTWFWSWDSGKYNTFFMKFFFALLLKRIYEDKTKMEEIVSKSELQWTIVRPWMLMDWELTESYRVETSLYSGISIWAISRADVADFLVKEAENQKYIHQYPALSLK